MIHITKFIDKIKATESKNKPAVRLTLTEAKDLHADITKLLITLHELQNSTKTSDNEIVKVEISGDNW